MRAVVCKSFDGGPDDLVVEDQPDPTAGEGEIVVAMKAAGVNFADTLMLSGKYQATPPLPFSPGMEFAGEVIEVGPGVTDFNLGDRVYGNKGHGAFAEKIVLPAQMATPIPEKMDWPTAATFIVAYGTSHYGLKAKAGLKEGEWLVVNGAAGGVGLTAVEVGKKLGAKVIALAGGQDKLEIAKSRGADYLIDYKTEDVKARIKEITGGHGADVIYDPVGGKAFQDAFRAIALRGRILIIGFASGDVPQLPANILLVKNVTAIGYYWGGLHPLEPEGIRDSNAELFKWWAEGKIDPHVSMTFPLDEAGEAIKALKERRSTGKVAVVT